MAQSASDVRAGGAFFELNARDNLTPTLAKLQQRTSVFARAFASFNPGAGGGGLANDLIFGKKTFDAKTKEYIGRSGGILGPLRQLFSPGAGGEGAINRWLFGEKQTDSAGKYAGRIGGVFGPLRKMFDSGAGGDGLINNRSEER